MYTSCGWFFDDISGIETVQIIAYAGRVLQLAKELFGPRPSIWKTILSIAAGGEEQRPQAKDGAQIYLNQVKSEELGLEEVAAHYAISSVFATYPEEARLFCYLIKRIDSEMLVSGRSRLVIGRGQVSSQLTGNYESVAFGALHFGDQNISAAVKRYDPRRAEARQYNSFVSECRARS